MKETPFNGLHKELSGKRVEFGGWEMPIQYSTISLEHAAVRNAAGIFDISHMGQVLIWGPEAEDYLQYLVSNDVRKAALGKGVYAHLLNEQGGVIDDIFIYRIEEEKFLVIINASRSDVDLEWMKKQLGSKFDATLMEAPFAAALAIQGPNAVNILSKLSSAIADIPRFGIADVEIGDLSVLTARTGYTGEDGFELFAPAGHLLHLWPTLMSAGKDQGLVPCGLGARDTLRTEVAYPLYGHELDEKHSPFEAGLDWVVKLDKGNFIGRQALIDQKAKGLPSKLLGFKVISGGVARPGGKIIINGKEIGTVASGTFSPTLNCSIGMAYFPTPEPEKGTKFTILQGTREITAEIVPLPFYSKKKSVKAGTLSSF